MAGMAEFSLRSHCECLPNCIYIYIYTCGLNLTKNKVLFDNGYFLISSFFQKNIEKCVYIRKKFFTNKKKLRLKYSSDDMAKFTTSYSQTGKYRLKSYKIVDPVGVSHAKVRQHVRHVGRGELEVRPRAR